MVKKSGRSGRKILVILNCIIVLLYLLVCLEPFLDPGQFWFIAVLGLVFPFLLVLVVVFLLIFAIKRSKWALLPLIALVLSWQQVSVSIGTHFFEPDFTTEKSDSTLRVLSWNVYRWDEQNKHAKGGVSYRSLMLDALASQNADVLCLQEFFEPRTNATFEKNIEVLTGMGYAYHYFYPSSIIWEGELQFGMAIFSRLPIIDSAKFSFGMTPHSEGLIYADIKAGSRIFRVFSVHMESSRTSNDAIFDKDGNGISVSGARGAVGSLQNAYEYRRIQAEIVREQLQASPHPVILCGNLGDIPNSYAYFKVKGNLQDAFLRKGMGFGRTYRFVSPTIRIDYILANKDFKVLQFGSPKILYSDHYPIIADFGYSSMLH